jgi:1,4-alpha-glucan branching enzyme
LTPQTEQHQLNLILGAQHHDPFNYLGLHTRPKKQFVFRTFLPNAENVWIKVAADWLPLEKTHQNGLFTWQGNVKPETPCLLKIEHNGNIVEAYDTYSFEPFISDDDLHFFAEGQLNHAYNTIC